MNTVKYSKNPPKHIWIGRVYTSFFSKNNHWSFLNLSSKIHFSAVDLYVEYVPNNQHSTNKSWSFRAMKRRHTHSLCSALQRWNYEGLELAGHTDQWQRSEACCWRGLRSFYGHFDTFQHVPTLFLLLLKYIVTAVTLSWIQLPQAVNISYCKEMNETMISSQQCWAVTQ